MAWPFYATTPIIAVEAARDTDHSIRSRGRGRSRSRVATIFGIFGNRWIRSAAEAEAFRESVPGERRQELSLIHI